MFHDIAFVNQSDRFAVVGKSIIQGSAHKTFGAGSGDGLDSEAGGFTESTVFGGLMSTEG